MTLETSKLVESISSDSLVHERVFEGSMIANEMYQDAVYDESGLLYTKLTLSNYNVDQKKSTEYADESLHYLRKKITHRQDELKSTLEKLEKIISEIKEAKEVNVDEGFQEIKTLSELINKKLTSARAQLKP